jgi:hypothetical protein
VPNLAPIVDTKLDELGKKLGPVGRPAIDGLLDGTPPGQHESFWARLKNTKTVRQPLALLPLCAAHSGKFYKVNSKGCRRPEPRHGLAYGDTNGLHVADTNGLHVAGLRTL